MSDEANLTPEEIAREVLRLDAEATPGPWDFKRQPLDSSLQKRPWWIVFSGRKVVVQAGTIVRNGELWDAGISMGEADRDLLAHSRNHAPALARAYLAAVAQTEAARKRVDYARKRVAFALSSLEPGSRPYAVLFALDVMLRESTMQASEEAAAEAALTPPTPEPSDE